MSKDNDEIISVKVAGTEYQLYCPKDEQRGLLNAADYLNKKVRKIKRQAKFLSMEKASVLAGLEVANELLNSDKVEIKEYNKKKKVNPNHLGIIINPVITTILFIINSKNSPKLSP